MTKVYIGKNDTHIDSMNSLISAFCAIRDMQLDKHLLYTTSRKTETLNINGATIKDVIFNSPATIVMWSDGSKTVVKCQEGDTYNPELGLAMCVVKKCCGNKGNFNDVFRKWLPKEGASNV